MQNRYACDIGDMGKFALLNALAGADLQLGVVWYLNPDEENNNDGAIVEYPELRECDEHVYDSLQRVLGEGDRSVATIQRAEILPSSTRFFSAPFTVRDLPPSNTTARRKRREHWLSGAIDAASGADLVFLDPDNGFAPDSVVRSANGAQKYVFPEEVAQFIARGQSVVVYHHHARYEGMKDQMERCFSMLRVHGVRHYWALTFHRRSLRTFFIASSPQHVDRLESRSRQLMTTQWGLLGHFQLHWPVSDWSQAAVKAKSDRVFGHARKPTKVSPAGSYAGVLRSPSTRYAEKPPDPPAPPGAPAPDRLPAPPRPAPPPLCRTSPDLWP
jgi:hypothetical protein